jgi:hypothetical protein
MAASNCELEEQLCSQQCCHFTIYIFSLQPLYYLYFCTTISNTDTRRVEGGKVHALALHVSNLSECSRRYGSNTKSKLVNLRVISVQNTPTATGRTSTLLRALYQLDRETTKEAELNIRSVRSGWVDVPNFDMSADSLENPQKGALAAGTAPGTTGAGAQQLPRNHY